MIRRLQSAISGVAQHFNRWRLVLVLFLLVYVTILMVYLDYALIQWDETQHVVSGLLLSRGQFQEYLQFSYYPPLFDVIVALTYTTIGSSLFSVRLVSLIFGVLCVWAVFEYAYRLYGPQNALLSSVLLASMPGFIIVCRMAILETILVFFFSIALLLFFSWMRTNNQKLLILSGVALGLGFLAKYQTAIAGLVMLVSVFLLRKKRVKYKMGKILIVAIIAAAVILPWLFLAYNHYTSEGLETWVYTVQAGSEERLGYGERFPLPVFYLIEMTYPYADIHPISLPVYIIAFLGLGLWLWRRKPEDKFSLIWFIVVYLAYTIFISNRNWRYIIPVFPILAVAASDFMLCTWNKLKDSIQAPTITSYKRAIRKFVAILFVLLMASCVVYSLANAYYWVEKDNIHIPIKEATQYVIENSEPSETAVVLFAVNYFSPDAVNFYLMTSDADERELWYYPEYPVDVYEPVFNGTYLIEQCSSLNVKYLFLYEHGNTTYFQSEWKASDVLDKVLTSGSFTLEKTFGNSPYRISVIRFSPNP
ncbi:MAG: glycosyltransferase family 39 protein [Candidatus Bathyarchaeota archaeon]|nr:glycosyltransferase family 39 protein [Candidatus Bathyarchaeum sp.]